MTAEAQQRPGPYTEAALALWAAGWRGVLPLPPRRKANPPEGYTGAQGGWPSYADVHAWTEGREGVGNVALRLPEHVLGIDVDNYADKHGGATLAACVARWGELPPTWRVTSRDDGVSGIALYAVPEGLAWPGELPGHDVELLQHRHRYAVAPPSVHPEGRRYRWHRPDGTVSLTPPHVDELPALPESWVVGLTQGRTAEDVARAGFTHVGQASAWLSARDGGAPCRAVRRAVVRALDDLRTGSRHDATLRATMRLARLAAERHTGVGPALTDVHRAFMAACADPSRGTARSQGEAFTEWASLLRGAVDVAAAQPLVDDPTDPCDNPLAGLLDHPAGQPERQEPWQHSPYAMPSGTSSSAPAAPSPGTAGSTAGPSTMSGPPPARAASSSSAPSAVPDPRPTYSTATDATRSETTGTDVEGLHELGLLTLDEQHLLAAQRQREHVLRVEAEVERLRAREAAAEQLSGERAVREWRAPTYTRTLREELAQPDVATPYVVDKLAPLGAHVLLTAQFKAGKTTTSNELARSLADGDPFLGAFGVHRQPGRVALWNYEVDPAQYRRWLRDVNVRELDRVAVLNMRGHRLDLTSRFGAEWAYRWLCEAQASAWCLDPFARAFTGDNENDNTQVARWLDALDAVADRAGIALLWLPTHTGRAEQEAGRERARGATRLDDWADARWLLTIDAKSGERYLRASGRDVEVPEGLLKFDPVQRRLTYTEGGRELHRTGDLQGHIVACIERNPGVGVRGLREYVKNATGKLGVSTFDAALGGLVSQGVVYVEQVNARDVRHYLRGTASTSGSNVGGRP